MKKEEFEKLKRLLSALPQYKRNPFDEDTWFLYECALMPFDYSRVRENAINIVRVAPFVPSIDELLIGLVAKEEPVKKKDTSWMVPYIKQRDEMWERMKERQRVENG